MTDAAINVRPSGAVRLVSWIKDVIIGTAVGLTPVTAILLLGWLMRDMRYHAGRATGAVTGPRPGWVMGDPGSGLVARAAGGLAANIRDGITAVVALALGTLPFAGFWVASWWAGWDNSFNKGYEQAVIGPLTGLSGVLIFMVMMIWLPMAQAHLAVEGRLSAFFEFGRIRSAVRHSGWQAVWWAAGLAILALPVFAARGLPVFAEQIVPGFADFAPEQIADFAARNTVIMALYLFVTLIILRRRQARIYARAALRAMDAGETAIWAGSQMTHAAGDGAASGRAPWLVFRWLRFALLLAIWWFVAAQIYVGQFLHHDWHVWLSHPLIALPWMP